MRSPGRRAAPRHRAPSVTARARAEAARLLRGADGAAPGAGEARDADGGRLGGDGELRGGRRAAGSAGRRPGPGWTGAAREGPAGGQADQPGAAQARGHPHVRRRPGRGRGRVPGRQHVPDRAALQRPHPGKPVHVRGLPRPGAARRHAGLGPPRRPHHAQRPLPRLARPPASSPAWPAQHLASPAGTASRPGAAAHRSPAWAASRSASRTSRSSSGPAASPTRSRSAGSAGPTGRDLEPGLRLPRGADRRRAGRALGAGPGPVRGWPRGSSWPGWGQPRGSADPVRLMVIVNGQPGAPSGCALGRPLCRFAPPASPDQPPGPVTGGSSARFSLRKHKSRDPGATTWRPI